MVGVLVKLKLRLLVNGFRLDTPRLIGFIVGLVFAIVLAGGACAGLILLGGYPELAVTVGVFVFTALALGWALLPLFLFGTDETLDPARLALLPLRPGTLLSGLFAAAVIGIPALATLLVLCGAVVGLSTGPVSLLFGVTALLLMLVLCIGLSRAVTTSLSGLLRSRRGRDFAIVFGVLFIFAVQGIYLVVPSVAVEQAGPERLTALFSTIAGWVRWTPSGAAAYAVADAGRGAYLLALGELALAAVAVALVLWWWSTALGRALVGYDSSTQEQGSGRGKGQGSARDSQRARLGGRMAGLLPQDRIGAVAAKDLRYFWRDPQRKVGLIAALGAAAILGFNFFDAPTELGAILAPAFAGLMLGLQAANQFGFDGPALWINIVATGSPRDLRADMAGKNLAASFVAVPLLLVISVAFAALSGTLLGGVTAFAVSCGTFGVTLALATIASTLVPYPVPENPTNVFSSPGGGRGLIVGVTTLALIFASALLSAPIVLPVLLGVGISPLLIVVAPAYGAAAAWLGRRVATTLAFPRMPQMLSEVTTNRSG